MTVAELKQIRRKWLDRHLPYKMTYWRLFNYDVLSNIMYRKKPITISLLCLTRKLQSNRKIKLKL